MDKRPIIEVAQQLGVNITRRSSQRCEVQCPIHGDTHSSLMLYVVTNSWYCFGCHRGGDEVALVSFVKRVGYADAASHLGYEANVMNDLQDKLDTPTLDFESDEVREAWAFRRKHLG